ncbi:MAG: hypothetical protein ACK4NH_10265, partial [Gemmobacter sp.]
MTALPSAESLTGANVTEGQFKAALATLRGYLAGLLGDSGEIAETLAALAVPFSSVAARTAAHTLTLGDRGRLLACSGSWTLGLPAAATAGAGFAAVIQNTGSGTITLDPAGAELLDGSASLPLLPGRALLLICTGSGWTGLALLAGSGAVGAADGSAAAPGLGFALDSDTGIFRPAANQLGFAAGGVPRAVLSAAGLQLDVPLTGTAVSESALDTTAG